MRSTGRIIGSSGEASRIDAKKRRIFAARGQETTCQRNAALALQRSNVST
jgi:hypothetical protein